MRNTYITTDTHFNHEAKMCHSDIGRPEDYADKLYAAFSKLSDDDILIHLGDICIGKDGEMHEKFIAPFKFKKILVRGNHDNKSNNWYLDNGWDFVCDQFKWDFEGQKIIFSHEPQPWDGVSTMNIHGHLHSCGHRGSPPLSFNRLLSLELHGYSPLSLSSFINKQLK